MKNCKVLIKTKSELKKVINIGYKQGITWASGDAKAFVPPSLENKKPITLFIRDSFTYGIESDFKDDDGINRYSYSEFIAKHKTIDETNFAVVVKTKKQLHDVETVLFNRGIIWGCSGKTHRDDFPYSPTVFHIHSKYMSYSSIDSHDDNDYDMTYTFKEFMDKYESKTSDIMKHCSVKVKTKAEVLEVESICSQHGVIWTDGDKHWIPDGLENGVYLVIEDVITNTSSLTTAKDCGPLYSFKEFMDKFAKSSSQILYRFKTETEFIEEFGAEFHDETNWNSSGNMDHLFGKELSDKENNNIQDIDQCRTDCDNWTIYKSMITEIKAGTIPIEITMNFKTEKFKLSDSLFEVDKPNLRLDK